MVPTAHGTEPHLAAVWFADICGYSDLASRDEPRALNLVEMLHRLACAEIEAQGGRPVKFIGDAVLAEFPSVRGAARAALSLANAFESAHDGAPAQLRIGVHLGEISEAADGDVYGDGVNLAARLQSQAEPGEVLVSSDVWRQLRQHPDFTATQRAPRRLRGTRGGVRVYSLTRLCAYRSGSERTAPTGNALPEFPFVGRNAERAMLADALERLESGSRGGAVMLSGEAGVGKTRLLLDLAAAARRRGVRVCQGRAYPMETGVPYALVTDAFRSLTDQPSGWPRPPGVGPADIPGLFGHAAFSAVTRAEDPAEYKGRLLWSFVDFLRRVSQARPLLVLLDDLQWADAASLEIVHFVARQMTADRVLIVTVHTSSHGNAPDAVRSLTQSLQSLGVAEVRRIEPLPRENFQTLVSAALDVKPDQLVDFTALLHEWTGGNPFFAREVLNALIAAGRIAPGAADWDPHAVTALELPATVRDAVLDGLQRYDPLTREIARLAAVAGTRVAYRLLRSAAGRGEADLLRALDELCRGGLLVERTHGDQVYFDFRHPIAHDVVYADVGRARRQQMHGVLGDALERLHGDKAAQHPDDLAYHLSRATVDEHGARAVHYLGLAGRAALDRFANREAADYFERALTLTGEALSDDVAADADPRGVRSVAAPVRPLLDGLARARQRVGDYDGAVAILHRLVTDAERRGDVRSVAQTRRRLGLNCYWRARHVEALGHFEQGVAAAMTLAEPAVLARLELARGACYQELGRAREARAGIERARAIAEAMDDVGLMARAYRALLLLHAWIGPADTARAHGQRAIELAERSGDPTVAFFSHWTLAALEGLTGHIPRMAEHITAGERLATELRSPLLRLWTDELSIELAWSSGDWDSGLETGARAITLARSLNQYALLPRLLVWTAIIRLGRGEIEDAQPLVEEAWRTSGAGRTGHGEVDVHMVVPAHIGAAALHMARAQYDSAIRIARTGLDLADRSGYPFWAIHRLLPIIAEASLHLRDLDTARGVDERLRRDSEQVGHRLGLAWADACRALITWLEGDVERGMQRLRAAVDALDAIPIVPDGARLRRQYAGRLFELGERTAALQELERAYRVLARLGAQPEIDKARGMFAEMDADVPQLTADPAGPRESGSTSDRPRG